MKRQRRKSERRTAAAIAVACLLASPACFVDARAVGPVARTAIWAAAIVGTAVIIESHDAHQHHEACGHYRRWHDERWVYYYQDRWEYYDADSGTWYVYAD